MSSDPAADRSRERRDVLKDRFGHLVDLTPTHRAAKPATRFETTPPLLDPSDEELGFAFAANLFDLFRAMSHLPDAAIEETPALARHVSFPFNPMFKGAWQTRLRDVDGAVDDTIRETIDWFRRRGAPFFFWWVDPRATPSDLGHRLEAHGLSAWELEAPGMVADLDALAYDQLARVPEGYDQLRVADDDGLRDFKAAFVEGFDVPDWAGQAWVDATLSFGIEDAPWHCYVGRLDGVPVASTMLFTGAGVASVFGVATVAAARGRGIGAAITLGAYDDARRAGYRHGVLFGTELGAPVYRRIGFRDVSATMSRYLWRAP